MSILKIILLQIIIAIIVSLIVVSFEIDVDIDYKGNVFQKEIPEVKMNEYVSESTPDDEPIEFEALIEEDGDDFIDEL